MEDRVIRLPKLKGSQKLPVVFSQAELRLLFKAPQRLKQRVLLSLIYSAGLRVSEVCKLKLTDLDFDRKQIHVRESKNNKSRYVVLSELITKGLKQYIEGSKPKVYLFNGRRKGDVMGHSAVQQSFRLAMQKAGIRKEACVHTLRHSFATAAADRPFAGTRRRPIDDPGSVGSFRYQNYVDVSAHRTGRTFFSTQPF